MHFHYSHNERKRGIGVQGKLAGKGKWRYRVAWASELLYGTIILHFKCPLSHAPPWRALPIAVRVIRVASCARTLCMWKSREKRRVPSRPRGTERDPCMVFMRGNYAVLRSHDNRIYSHKICEVCSARNAHVSHSLWYTSWAYRHAHISQCRILVFSCLRGGVFTRASLLPILFLRSLSPVQVSV